MVTTTKPPAAAPSEASEPLGRRDFLVRTGLAVSAGALGLLADCGPATQRQQTLPAPADRPTPSSAAPPPAPPPAAAVAPVSEWERVRALFPLAPDRIHMAGLLLASHPTPVREAIETHRRGLDQNPVDYLHHNKDPLEAAARAAAARYMGGAPDDIALTDSTTMGLGLLYTGLTLRAGDEVLATAHDHYSTLESLRFATARSGATLRRIPLYEHPAQASAEGIVEAIARGIARRTRIVAITWVHSGTGVRLPVRAIAEAVAAHNARRSEAERVLLSVDGVHGFGSAEDRVEDLGCDFFVAGCHKWLFGPRGTGVVWGRPAAWARVRPTIPAFETPIFEALQRRTPGQGVPPALAFTPGGFHSFEHRWALPAAFALHEELGRAKVWGRIAQLNTRMKEGLAAMPHVTLHTPMSPSLSAGIVCFEVRGQRPSEVVERLAPQGIIASTTPYAVSYARFTPGLWNTPEEVDRTLAAVRALG